MHGYIWGPDGTPDDEQVALRRRMEPPNNEVPAVVPLVLVVARTDETAVFITGTRVYSTGVMFSVHVRSRSTSGRPNGLQDLFFGPQGYGARGGILLGVELADGTAVSNMDRDDAREPRTDGPVLGERGSHGDVDAYDAGYWLSPVPPPGPMSFIVSCPALDVTETVLRLDAAPLAAAAANVATLWPWEPPAPYEPAEPPLPDLPADSWFASRVRKRH